MVEQHYRWDFIGLSTDQKPTPETSEKVVDGSTFYCSDTSKLYVYCKNNWYEKTVSGGGGTSYTAGTGIDITGSEISVDTNIIQPKLTAGTNITISDDNTISATGGGGGPTVVQTTGGSTTDVMSQLATTNMVFNGINVQIGSQSDASGSNTVAVGSKAKANGRYGVALGVSSTSSGESSISFPGGSTTVKGVMEIGLNASSGWATYGYNNSAYRLISGVYDGQSPHDAVTVGQVNSVIDAINAALSTNISHIGA